MSPRVLEDRNLHSLTGNGGAEIQPGPQDGVSFEEEVLFSAFLFNFQAIALQKSVWGDIAISVPRSNVSSMGVPLNLAWPAVTK